MQISGEYRFRGPQAAVWELLNDTDVLARCLPGCERLDPVGDGVYTAVLKMGLAAIRGTYTGQLRFSDLAPPGAMTIQMEGKGTLGFVNAGGRVELEPLADDATRLSYAWDVHVGGQLAMAGQRVLGGVAKMVVDSFFQAMEKELAL